MLKHPHADRPKPDELALGPRFGVEGRSIPRHELPEYELPAEVAYQIVHDELMLDGNARTRT